MKTKETKDMPQPVLHDDSDNYITIVFKLTDRKLLDALYQAFKTRAEFGIGRPVVLSWGNMSNTVENMDAYIESLEDSASADDLNEARKSYQTKCQEEAERLKSQRAATAPTA